MSDRVTVNVFVGGRRRRPDPWGLVFIPGGYVPSEAAMPSQAIQLQIPAGFGQQVQLNPTFHAHATEIDGLPELTDPDGNPLAGFALRQDPAFPGDSRRVVIDATGDVGTAADAVITADARKGPDRKPLVLAVSLLVVAPEADSLTAVPGDFVELAGSVVADPATAGASP